MGFQSQEQRFNTRVTFNGINGATGRYGIQPLTVNQLVAEKVNARWYSNDERDTIRQHTRARSATFGLGCLFGDPTKVQNAGWGIIFPALAPPDQVNAILEALAPLIEVRQNKYFKVFRGPTGYLWQSGRGQSFLRFLQENGAGVGPADPNKIPYYLLLVGDPQSIPYQFQYDLDTQYIVGRIYFEELEHYYNYAKSVSQAEDGRLKLPRKVAFFGPQNLGDNATHLSSEYLIKPLANFYQNDPLVQPLCFQVDTISPDQSNKKQLARLLGGDQAPALLFTASHGVEWPYGDDRQVASQGALLCQDWPGPYSWESELDDNWFFSGIDLLENKQANLLGMISFHFACFGAGTPYWDEFAGAHDSDRPALARRPFIASLPKAILSHPNGGASAVIGHVERAWSYSFEYKDGGLQLEAFKEVLNCLMLGQPVGIALKAMNDRYATFASSLIQKVDKLKNFPDLYTPEELAFEWISANDAKGYSIIGDPAARLSLCPLGEELVNRSGLTLNSPIKGKIPEVLDPNSRPDPELSANVFSNP